MKLFELSNPKKSVAVKALKENYNIDFNVKKLRMDETTTMLRNVRKLMEESKKVSRSENHRSSYMKLVFMEQALADHLKLLRSSIRYNPKIMLENEAVQEAQVTLAAQEMVDTVQKMVEQVSDMLVKELPALSDSTTSEIGVNELQQFTQKASEVLKGLQDSLSQSKSGLQEALGILTGQGGQSFDDEEGMEEPEGDMEEPEDDEMPSLGDEEGMEEPEEPEDDELGNVGRTKRM